MELFKKFRPRDINLEYPIGNEGEKVTYYEFEDKALNGFENTRLKTKDQTKIQNKLLATHQLDCSSLDSILLKYLPEGQEIDFLSIDVEGNEMLVLLGLNLYKFKPKVIIIEILDFEFQENNIVYDFLINHQYLLKAKTINTCVFISNFDDNLMV